MKNVLLIGSGGREHAIAWKLSHSAELGKLYICPGNPDTAQLGENIDLKQDDYPGLISFSIKKKINLVIVGPEIPLADGLADLFQKNGIPVFGPSKAGAQIESSKTFSKEFMQRHNIPTAQFKKFSSFEEARKALEKIEYPIVIKASGLAAGKGVILPSNQKEAIQTLREIMLDKIFGDAGKEIIIEERLEGEEVSLLAFTDGYTISPMPPAQDHKRLLDKDMGPNTGGMGTYAPAPVCPPQMVEEFCKEILQPTIDGLREEGILYTGVLYAGLILTKDGPKVLEFNCRFGDPETQVILPLLDSDLLQIFEACCEQKLSEINIKWKESAAVCVVAASENYPESSPKGKVISGLDELPENTYVFQAGTALQEGKIVNSGGRVLGITGFGPDLASAVKKAYQAVEGICFEGMQYRKDIAQKGLKLKKQEKSSAYAMSGVDIDAGHKAVELMSRAVKSTYNQAVLGGIGSFGGLYSAAAIKTMQKPVLVASTDGVGTKVKLAAKIKNFKSIGKDIVNHCIDDILVQGAYPLFFLDYVASSKLDSQMIADIVTGMSEACRESDCVLLGGETAEMPGVYESSEFDVAGTIVGILEQDKILPRKNIKSGDKLVGLASSGPHTNGFSLLRQIFKNFDPQSTFPGLKKPLYEALLEPHRSYLPLLKPVLEQENNPIKALAHLTGGGFYENIPRVLPENLDALIFSKNWTVPRIFTLAQELGNISFEEMYRVFNMGIGMVAVVAEEDLDHLQASIPEETWLIGELRPGNGKVQIA